MRALLTLGLCCAISAVLLAGPIDATPEQIQNAVKELGDDDYYVREKATQFLWSVGAAAEPALREALKDRDAEVVARARDLLNKIPFGIKPGSPKQFVTLIERARAAGPDSWPALAAEIIADGPDGLDIARMIADKQPTPERRKQYQRGLDREGWRAAPRFIVLGKWDVAEDLLRRSAVVNAGAVAPKTEVIVNYAAFLRERGTLSERIPKWAALAKGKSGVDGLLGDGTPDGDAAKCILGFLHTANGDFAAALPVFESIGRAEWLEQARFNTGAWSALAASVENDFRENSLAAAGLRLIYSDLAGNKSATNEARAAFAKLADEVKARPPDAWLAFRSLMYARQVDDAVKYAEAINVPQAALVRAEILAQHGHIDDALNVLTALTNVPASYRTALDMTKTRLLYLAGRRQALDEHLAATRRDRIAPSEQQAANDYLDQLLNFGLTDEATAVAAAVLNGGKEAKDTFAKLHPGAPEGAEAWYAYLRHHSPTESSLDTLKRLAPLVDRRLTEPANRELLDVAVKWSRSRSPAEREKLLRGFGDVCAAVGLNDLAVALLQESSGELRLGDFYAEAGRWAEAATAYEKAARHDDKTVLPLPLFLAGFAKEKAGDAAGGRATQTSARTLLLAVDNPRPDGGEKQRADFYTELAKRYHLDPAIRSVVRAERQLLVDLSHPKSSNGRNAQSLLCQDRGAFQNAAAAVAGNERFLIRMLRTNAYFRGSDSYLAVLYRRAAAQARAHLAAGRLDDAMASANEAHQLLPGSYSLAVELYGELRQRGENAEGDVLYGKVATFLDKQLKDHPDSDSYMTNRAWLAARCGKDLDLALALSKKATELAPANPAAHEALAEVQFQRKDAAAAKAALANAQKLQPWNRYIPKLVKRVEAGDPAAPLPER